MTYANKQMRGRFIVSLFGALLVSIVPQTQVRAQPIDFSNASDPIRAVVFSEEARFRSGLTSVRSGLGRIVGGTNALPGEYPWQVALVVSGFTPSEGFFAEEVS